MENLSIQFYNLFSLKLCPLAVVLFVPYIKFAIGLMFYARFFVLLCFLWKQGVYSCRKFKVYPHYNKILNYSNLISGGLNKSGTGLGRRFFSLGGTSIRETRVWHEYRISFPKRKVLLLLM